ncbi:MAG: metal ABC transporter permease [Leptodesmis sp.]|uniref:metal ABC transporter permease n=1 Tax=Leptodesmis sp. TaxID=3100501 RepID=UPI003D0D1E2A
MLSWLLEPLNYEFMVMITLNIIASMQSVGVILVISLLIGPALTAYLLTRELHQMISLTWIEFFNG